VLVLSSLASFMVILDMLVVATALNSIQRSLGASLVDLEWTVNAYTLSFAVFLMTAATLGGRLGRRRVFVAGLAVFGLASVACALAPNVGVLVAARAVQGLGAAAVMPMALALLNVAFPAERRGWATGIYGSIGASAVVVGPILGGLVAQGLSWEWIFWLNVPIALAAIPLVLTRIPEGYGPVIPIDLPGLGLAAAGAFGLVWGLIRASDGGWSSPSALGLLVGGALLSVAFVAWERHARVPMLPLRLFGSPAFSAGSVVIFLLNGALTAAVFFTAQYLQIGLGNGPLSAGLRLAPWGIAPLLLAARAGALADRLGERLLVIVGMILLAGGTGWLALVAHPDTGYLAIVLPMLISGLGNAVAIPAVTKAVVSSVALPDIGAASGTYSTMRQLGGAFGVAVIGAVFAVTGGYGSAADFSDGYRAAIGACAAVAVAGAAVGLALGRRRTASAHRAAPLSARPMAAASRPVQPSRVESATAGSTAD
jgi:EmrB/QacA subfamily drug resistance transporter